MRLHYLATDIETQINHDKTCSIADHNIPYGGMQKFIIFYCLFFVSSVFARPISYVGGHTLMANSNAQTDNIYWHYTPDINYSFGLDYQKDEISNKVFPSARFTVLLNRKNTATSQSNLYLKTGVGLEYGFTYFYTLAGDWETRRVFVGFAAKKMSGTGYQLFEQSIKLGVAPYLGDYGDLHTWLMIETKKNTFDDQRTTYPVLRLFKGGALMEVSYHKKTDWNMHLMYRF